MSLSVCDCVCITLIAKFQMGVAPKFSVSISIFAKTCTGEITNADAHCEWKEEFSVNAKNPRLSLSQSQTPTVNGP